jgi:hypothetical protein
LWFRRRLGRRILIGHAPQDQRELAGALRQDDRLGLKRREFQGCIGSCDDALPIFLLKILADREDSNFGQMVWLTKELATPLRAAPSS